MKANISASAIYRAAMALLALVVILFPPGLNADKNRKLVKNYGLIFGTAYGPDEHPLYGVKVDVYPVGKKTPHWDLVSDHRGEFAQRVPPGPGDYVVQGTADVVPLEEGVPNTRKKKRLKAEVRVHIEGEERQDVSLHLTE